MRNLRGCLFVAVAMFACFGAADGQVPEVENGFEQRKSVYKVERFNELIPPMAPGEQGTRFDYLYYTDGNELVKIRKIEGPPDPGPSPTVKVDDYFFENGRLQLVRLYLVTSGTRLKSALGGEVLPLGPAGEHIEFTDGKLTKWIVFGKSVPTTDRRWKDKQTSVEISTRLEIAQYREFTSKDKK